MITYRAGDSSAKNTKSHINRRITGPILLAFHSFTILLTIRVADGTFWLLISKILNFRRFARPFQQLVEPMHKIINFTGFKSLIVIITKICWKFPLRGWFG